MRRRCILLALILILALAPACSAGASEAEGYRLYFLTDSDAVHGPALDTEPYTGGQGLERSGQSQPTPLELVQALLDGPKTDGLTSPFPRGLSVLWLEWDTDNPGVLLVGLSEQYGGLTDISLTLADYCIVLTLAQLDEIDGVEIISGGHTANYRSHQLLQPEEAVLIDIQAKG